MTDSYKHLPNNNIHQMSLTKHMLTY